MKQLVMSLLGTLALAACGPSATRPLPSDTKEPINPRNDPVRIDRNLADQIERRVDGLPTSGTVSQHVWYGNWYPMSQGGTADVLALYDRATGQPGTAEAYERAKAAQSDGVSWAGHCNGLAAASINTPEPVRAVTYNGVVFQPSDIKGLLVEIYQGDGGTPVVGGRCNLGTITVDQYGRPVSSSCRDLNAGALHLALTNFIGRHRVPVILDIEGGHEVWNYAVKEYSFDASEVSREEATELAAPGADAYPFNAEAARFTKVDMWVQLASGSTLSLDYLLELTADGAVIGGEWIGGSRTDHPDFVWRMTVTASANPYVSPSIALDIAEGSF